MEDRKEDKKDKLSEYKEKYIGMTNKNNQGCTMTIVDYINYHDVIVEFDDERKTRKHCHIKDFKKGQVKNPFSKSIYGIGITGDKYPTRINKKQTKEYTAWKDMLKRCYDEKYKIKRPTYKNVTCCKEWLYYPNFYEWLHSQNNFNKWFNNNKFALDKDIIKKNNQIYSQDRCCLVPQNVNLLFVKNNAARGSLPIGVRKYNSKYRAELSAKTNKGKNEPSIKTNKGKKMIHLGTYDTPEEAFNAYKEAKEKCIRQVAEEEFSQGNITKECYNAMMNYEVEITD